MKKVYLLLVFFFLGMGVVACGPAGSATTSKLTPTPVPIALTRDNVDYFLNIDCSVSNVKEDIKNGYFGKQYKYTYDVDVKVNAVRDVEFNNVTLYIKCETSDRTDYLSGSDYFVIDLDSDGNGSASQEITTYAELIPSLTSFFKFRGYVINNVVGEVVDIQMPNGAPNVMSNDLQREAAREAAKFVLRKEKKDFKWSNWRFVGLGKNVVVQGTDVFSVEITTKCITDTGKEVVRRTYYKIDMRNEEILKTCYDMMVTGPTDAYIDAIKDVDKSISYEFTLDDLVW